MAMQGLWFCDLHHKTLRPRQHSTVVMVMKSLVKKGVLNLDLGNQLSRSKHLLNNIFNAIINKHNEQVEAMHPINDYFNE